MCRTAYSTSLKRLEQLAAQAFDFLQNTPGRDNAENGDDENLHELRYESVDQEDNTDIRTHHTDSKMNGKRLLLFENKKNQNAFEK